MNAAADTICAVATAPGTAGIAVVRVSGPQAFTICDTLWRGKRLADVPSHTAHLGTVRDTDATVLDQAVATVFRGPHSYTGEDVVELSVHGSPYVQHRLIELLCKAGARLAEPGEFTRRAFTAGNIDLSQAEAIADLIAARSRAAHHVAVNQLRGGITRRLLQLREQLVDLSALLELELDFSEEDVEFADRTRLIALAEEINREVTRLHGTYSRGQAIRDGIPVAIAGPTNAGKSSLLNALVGDDRAIVSDVHGTTRDTVEDTLTLGDHLVRIIDTAGLRATTDTVELIGQERTRAALTRAALRLIVFAADDSRPLPADLVPSADHEPTTSPGLPPASHEPVSSLESTIFVVNKTDLTDSAPVIKKIREKYGENVSIIPVSALTGAGLSDLEKAVTTALDALTGNVAADLIITNARQAQALADAAASSAAVIAALRAGLSADLVALDLRDTIAHLSSLLTTATDDPLTAATVLSAIFSRFCIGK